MVVLREETEERIMSLTRERASALTFAARCAENEDGCVRTALKQSRAK